MSKALSNLLRYIDKLPFTQKEQVYQWVKRYVLPSSYVGGHLINEMRETHFKEGFETDAWRAYKTYAKEKGIEIIALNQMMGSTL